MRALKPVGVWIALASLAPQLALASAITGYTFTTLDDPAASRGTFAWGINDAGQVAGWFGDATGDHGFLYNGGSWTTLDHPNANPGSTLAYTPNDSGQTLGLYFDASGGHYAIYNGTTWRTLGEAPGAAPQTTTYGGINDSGVLSGFYLDSHDGLHPFLYDGTTYTPLTSPSDWQASPLVPLGLNDAGAVSGYYYGRLLTSGGYFISTHGFIFDGTAWTGFDALDAEGLNTEPLSTTAWAINDTGLVAGTYTSKTGVIGGFVYDGTTFTEFGVPNADPNSIYVTGINDSGEIVGRYTDSSGVHGFIGTPVYAPEPATLTLLGLGLVGVRLTMRRRSG